MSRFRDVRTPELKLLAGDCLVCVEELPDDSVELIATDPPFLLGQQYDRFNDSMGLADYMEFIRKTTMLFARKLAPTGQIAINMTPRYSHLWRNQLEYWGLHYQNMVVWHFTFGPHQERRWASCHTDILVYSKHPRDRYFLPGRIESERQRLGDRRANPNGRVPSDVWTFSRLAGTFKRRVKGGPPNQMPIEVCTRLVESLCPPGATVVDPMCGSGTFLAAALATGRKAWGCDLSPKYCKVAYDRLFPMLNLELTT